MNHKKAEELMEKGWKAREEHNFEDAEVLLMEAKDLFEKDQDWFNVTECLNHLAYNEKLRANKSISKGLQHAKNSYKIAIENSTKIEHVLRALMSLTESAYLHEESLIWALESLKEYKKPAQKADILGHIALCELRTGKASDAKKTIEKAEKLLEEGFDEEKEPHKYIWKTKLLNTRTLIFYSLGDEDKAIEVAKESLEISVKHSLKTRIEQAKHLLEFLKEQLNNEFAKQELNTQDNTAQS